MIDINKIKVGDKVCINVGGWMGYGTPLPVTEVILNKAYRRIRLKHPDGTESSYLPDWVDYYVDYYNEEEEVNKISATNKLIEWLQTSKSV